MRMNSRGAKPFHCILVADAPGSNRLCPCRRWWGPRADPPAAARICLVPGSTAAPGRSVTGWAVGAAGRSGNEAAEALRICCLSPRHSHTLGWAPEE